MNLTLRKYELMKELGIKSCVERINTGDDRIFWNIHALGWSNDIITPIAAAILERACREWLEKYAEIEIRQYAGETYMLYGVVDNNVYSFDAAQIAALEYCLKEKNHENSKSNLN